MQESKYSPIFTHHHPHWLLKRPQLLSVIYLLSYLTQLRKWYITSRLSKLLSRSTNINRMLDVGCGEGQYLFPYATAYPNRRFVGVDKNEQNIALCNSYIARKKLNNTTILHSSIESMPADAPYDLIICVGVLQYIADDQKAIEVMHDSLSDQGKFLLYVPVNNRGILSFYQQLMKSYPNYESVQDRKRIYTEEAVRSLLQQANFTIINRTATYGFFGILSNELFNSCTLLIVNAALPIRLLVALLSVFIYPFILLCMLLDFLLPIRSGNGLLLIAQKNS